MINISDKKTCCGCGACENICPQKCIKMTPDNEGFIYPQIDSSLCSNCGLCKRTCPILNANKETFQLPECYAAYSLNEKDLINSSSGGIFSLLANYILANGGVVYGAAFIDAYNVSHIRIASSSELYKLQGSKYLQSQILDAYEKVKADLNNGITVLFTGCSCHISALKKYLHKDYKNLYTQDIICHGVPSPKVWKKYLIEKKYSSSTIVSFRNKNQGWNNFSLKLKNNKKSYIKHFKKDLYMNTFLSNCNLRPSCYDCKFKTIHRDSDITLSDFWGIKDVIPSIYNFNGVSAICIHTKKGKDLFSHIKNNVHYCETSFLSIIDNNSPYLISMTPHKNRSIFFKKLDSLSLKRLVRKYIKPSFTKKIARYLYSHLRRSPKKQP